jgi:hypothetical protein
MENGNYEIYPTNHILPHELKIVVGRNHLWAAGNFGHDWNRFIVELPSTELMLSCVRENVEYTFADIDVDHVINFSYLEYPSASKIPPVNRKTYLYSRSLGNKKISISPQNIDRLFDLCSRNAAETKVSVLFYKPSGVRSLLELGFWVKGAYLCGYSAATFWFLIQFFRHQNVKVVDRRSIRSFEDLVTFWGSVFGKGWICFIFVACWRVLVLSFAFIFSTPNVRRIPCLKLLPLLFLLNLLISLGTFDFSSWFIICLFVSSFIDFAAFGWKLRGNVVNFMQGYQAAFILVHLFYIGFPFSVLTFYFFQL